MLRRKQRIVLDSQAQATLDHLCSLSGLAPAEQIARVLHMAGGMVHLLTAVHGVVKPDPFGDPVPVPKPKGGLYPFD